MTGFGFIQADVQRVVPRIKMVVRWSTSMGCRGQGPLDRSLCGRL
jgi:hypothetical protein